jgi:hypothetical protein
MLSAVEIDHLILGIMDLTKGTERFAALSGVVPMSGGEHPGRNTRNALASLGDGVYLEILAATDPHAAPLDPKVRYSDLTFSGWALRTSSIQDVVDRLRAAGLQADDPVPGSRRNREGRLIEWKTAAARGPGLELAPFLIQWSPGATHPSAIAPSGCRLRSLELEHVNTAPLDTFFNVVGLQQEVKAGKMPAARMVLDCPTGLVTFSS